MNQVSPSVHAVVFDIDDTLYPERQYIRSGYAAVAEHLRRKRTTAERYEDWLWNRFLTDKAAGAFDALNEHFGLALDSAGIAELIETYRGHRPAIAPYEGMRDLLRQLRTKYRLGIISDGFLPAQKLKLDALGLADLFEAVVFTEELGRPAWKPAPDAFELLARKMSLPHIAFAYVADNPGKDFIAPNRLGWATIQLALGDRVHKQPPPLVEADAQFRAETLDQLRGLLGVGGSR